MKKLFLTLLICLFCVTPAWSITKIVDLSLATDLADDEGTLAAGAIVRSTTATYIHGGVLYTAAINVARFEDGWLRFDPAATNQCLYSRDLSNAAWVKTNCTGAQTQIGLDLAANSASLLTATAANATALQTIVLVSTAKTFSVYIKRSVGTGSIYITDDNGGNYTECTGLSSAAFTKYKITRTQADPVIGFKIAIDGDAIIIDCNQLEETSFSTRPIHTTNASAARTTEAGSAADNGFSWTHVQATKNVLDDAEPVGSPTDSQGTLLFDVKWGCDESDIAASGGLVGVQNSPYSTAYFSTVQFSAHDGTNPASDIASPAFSAGDIITYATRWGDVDGNANDLSVGLREAEGAWGFDATPGDYDGAFTLGTKIRLGYDCLYPFHIRNIELWDEPFAKARQVIAGVGGTLSYDLIDTTDGGYFDGVQVTGATNTIENCTIYAPYGNALNADESCTVTNCILEGKDKDIDIAAAKTVTAKNNLLPNHANATTNIGAGTYTDANSVYAQSPLFRNVAGQDFHLQAGSPCVGTGYNTGADTDLDGMPTPRGVMDIGCYELFKNTSMYMGMGLKGYCPFRED